ncbi:Myb-like DNA-binding domain-containing protein [Pyrococcus kukulkanii]|uniref:Myb-like DNA-binding domain-containing protein n=1 Tax=Pyrococcus kukulkanii TaxID=1609559 RepID=UPI003563E6F4
MAIPFKKPRAYSNNPWTKEEEQRLLYLLWKGYSPSEIATYFPNRSKVSIKNKIRKMKIKYDLYGGGHRKEKYQLAEEWVRTIKPKTVLDGFAGRGNLTKIYLEHAKTVYAVEIKRNIFESLKANIEEYIGEEAEITDRNTYVIDNGEKRIVLINSDIKDAVYYLGGQGITFDFIDLDPCGTPIPVIPLLPKILKEDGYLAITFGDFHSYRFKRYDVLAKTVPILFDIRLNEGFIPRNIKNIEEFNKYLIVWVSILWILPQDVHNFTYLELIEKHLLGKKKARGVLRALFRVKKGKSNAEILQKIQDTLIS